MKPSVFTNQKGFFTNTTPTPHSIGRLKTIIALISLVGAILFTLGLLLLLYVNLPFIIKALCGGILCFVGSHFTIAAISSLLKLRRMNINGG